MTKTQGTVMALASVHLTLVATGAAHLFSQIGDNIVSRPLQWYGTMSGADAGYNFFAPRVGSQLRVGFVLTNQDGQQWEDNLEGDANQEVRLRLGSLSGLFPQDREGENLRRDLSASWAAVMFGRYPTAEVVEVRVEVYQVPSMAEYRAGSRPEWQPVHSSVFRRAPRDEEVVQP
jgi:hypothetical protein